MYWYNPATHTSERVEGPSDDEQALHMLSGHPASVAFVSEYAELRRSGTPVEPALVLVGHEERLRQHDCTTVRLVEYARPRRRKARPSAHGYELLVALRLREEDRNRQRVS